MSNASHNWFRYYNGTANDRKLRRIAAQMGIQRVIVLGAWAGIMEMANSSPVWGCLLDDDGTPLTVENMSEDIGIDNETFQKLLHHFEARAMLANIDGIRHLTNWDKRQFQSDTSTERVRAYRERQKSDDESAKLESPKNVTDDETFQKRDCNVSETHHRQRPYSVLT